MSLAQKVNVLRASVMGANDGIISIAGIVIGVAAATSNARSILIAGLSGTLAGMISMCMGEYVSVSTQKDSQKMALISEKQRLQNQYQHEFDYVQKKYEAQDIDPQLAKQATKELMEKDALGTAVQERYGFNPNEFTSPYAAAIASFIPARPSAQRIKISFTPRFFSSFNTESQYFELSLSPTLIVNTSFFPSVLMSRMT